MSRHSLIAAWSALICLTAVVGFAAGAGETTRPSAMALIFAAAATLAKARIILARYLGLTSAPTVLAGFTAAVAIALAIVTASFVVTGLTPG